MRYLNGIIMCFLLTSCQQKHLQTEAHVPERPSETVTQNPNISLDGPPATPSQRAARHVEPKKESLSRYGNVSTYRVNGQSYDVLTTAHGYHEKGLASWYGTKFHKKRTSSGEDYDLYEFTAAHKTLPLPTYVKVKNLKNGRELVVKVNDRGPFHSNRILDLSYGAAKKLGFAKAGTTLVEIEAISTNAVPLKPAQFYLQAGAFSVKKFAEQFRGELAQMTAVPVFVESYKKYFIVKAGPFPGRDTVNALKQKLAGRGMSGAFSVLQ